MSENTIHNVNILLVDDDEAIRDSLSFYLEQQGWNVKTAENAKEAIESVKEGYGDIVISDIRMPEMDGITLLKKLKDIDPDLEVLIITGHSNEQLAIEALKEGAFDYFTKPLNGENISNSLHKTHKVQLLKKENQKLKILVNRMSNINKQHSFIGSSNAARELLNKITKVAKVREATVLLNGESGVGKEVVAHLIHKESINVDEPFIAINCGGIAETLLESELFGHEKGAFTGADKIKPGIFEIAKGGTILLDEISEMSMRSQSRFLRILEERKYRRVGGTREISMEGTRIIAATNKNLEKLVEDGEFRNDLYFRINIATIDIPALRERKQDILSLCDYFLSENSLKTHRDLSLGKGAENAILNYDFPGNIRELRNMLERAAIFATEEVLTAADLGLLPAESVKMTEESYEITTLNLAENEALLIKRAIDNNPENHSAAARLLGITPQTLYRKIEKFEL